VFQVEILSSSTRIEPNSMFFNKLPKKYSVREIYGKDTGIYSYIVDQQLSIMATYIAYKDMISSGYKNVKTKIEILTDPAEKELYNLKKIFGIQTDTYFDKNNRLTSSAYILLDQITKLMVKYPGIRLEIGVHTDNGALPESKLALSLNYSHIVANYLINKGIDSRRLVTKGYGSIRPIASNTSAYDRVLNRRIDFVIVKE
jgi:outer membrane protein OmpA-like peptidoglycan-associated protein